MTEIEEIKERVKIVDLVGESFTVAGSGRTLTTKEHDSLKLWPESNSWFWYSKAIGGDVFDWWQHIHQVDFRTALDELANRANVELHPLTPEARQAAEEARTEQRQREQIFRLAAEHYHAVLCQHPQAEPARRYCNERGWDEATVQREGIGYVLSTDNNGLSADDFDLVPLHRKLREAGYADHPAARAVLSIPVGMLVYTHRERGRIVYLSARSIEGKRHYNLPEELVGKKPAYHNEPVRNPELAKCDFKLLVEGQADAISLGILGIEATALCGLAANEATKATHVALDNDDKGQQQALDLALSIGPLCRIVTWPDAVRHPQEDRFVDVKDAADLVRAGTTAGDLLQLLEIAPTAIASLAAKAGQADENDTDAIEQFFAVFTSMDGMTATKLKPGLAKLICQGNMAQFNRLLKEYKKQTGQDKPAGERFEHSAGGAKGGQVWEQCVVWDASGTGKVIYAVRDADGAIKQKPTIDVGGVSYIPFPATMGLIETEVVLFPEKPVEYGSEKELVNEIRNFIHTYLDVDPFYEKLAAYYVLFTWLYDLFENLPYLRALGDYGTGKTRFIQVIGACCYRPMFTSGASTTSPVFNVIDIFSGTLIIDEADFGNSDADAEIIKILNVGYYKKGVVLRSEKDPNEASDKYWPSAKRVYGPKILATRKPFVDRATESRCLTKRMTTARPRPGIPYTLEPEFWRAATELRNKLLMYRLRNHRPMLIDQRLADESVEPRLNQVTMALKTVIKDEEMRKDIDTFIRAYNEVLISDRQMTLPAVVVQALAEIHWKPNRFNVLGEDTRDFTMKGIADKVQAIISDIDPDARVNAKQVSAVLNEDLGLVNRVKHPQNRREMVKYTEEELIALMARYGVEKPLQ